MDEPIPPEHVRVPADAQDGARPTGGTDWKQAVKAELGRWIDELDEPPPEMEPPPEVPSQQQLWEAIIALEAHTRTYARKTIAALEAFSAEMRTARAQEVDPLASLQGMAELNAQLDRMRVVLATSPAPLPFRLSRRWEAAWRTVAEGTAILQRSVESVLQRQGIRMESPAEGDLFDPATMEALEVLPGSGEGAGRVRESIEPAYFHAQRLLRPARVRVARG